jgi:hypothetical protein
MLAPRSTHRDLRLRHPPAPSGSHQLTSEGRPARRWRCSPNGTCSEPCSRTIGRCYRPRVGSPGGWWPGELDIRQDRPVAGDTSYTGMDPIIIAGPWILAGGALPGGVRAVRASPEDGPGGEHARASWTSPGEGRFQGNFIEQTMRWRKAPFPAFLPTTASCRYRAYDPGAIRALGFGGTQPWLPAPARALRTLQHLLDP